MNHQTRFASPTAPWSWIAIALLVIAGSFLAEVLPAGAQPATPSTAASPAAARTGPEDVILATTTSTQDSGLLDLLVPMFEEATGYHLKPIAVGSGAALKLGERGEADVVLAHSPAAEREFMTAGFGTDRRVVMFNDFVLVGPPADPARIAGMTSAVEAMRAIATSSSRFVSRGDDSGTNKLELDLWRQAGITPAGAWYIASGTGMGETLNIANERDAYTLTDRATLLALSDRLDLTVLVEGDRALRNVYHVLLVNPNNGDAVNTAGATAFADFLVAPATQKAIAAFGVDRVGQPLFFPCARNSCGLDDAATPAAATPAATP